METYIHERVDGQLVEYRRHPYDRDTLHVEGRVLQANGMPYDDQQWFRVGDAELLQLQLASGIVDILSRCRHDLTTPTADGATACRKCKRTGRVVDGMVQWD